MPSSSSHPPALDIQLFGRFQAKVNGLEVDDKRWGRRSAKALVKLLSLAPPHTLHREQIIEALWPDLEPRTAANNLDKAIHGARRAFEPDLAKGAHSRFILTPRNQLILASPGALRVDAHLFEQSANQALREQDAVAARAALQLYAGTLLVDDLFEEWTQLRRESLQQLFSSTAISAAELFAKNGDPASGIELARRLMHEDAADERAHLLLMRLYAQSGRKDQALLQFEQCSRSLLAAGLEVGAEIRLLHQALRDELAKPAPAASAVPHAPAPLSAAWSPQVVPITFRNGIIRSARAAADGQSVLLMANWNHGEFGLYRLTPASGHAELLLAGHVELFAVSTAGHRVLGLRPRVWNIFNTVSTLAIQPASGGAPTELLEGVQCADLQPGAGQDSVAAIAERLAIVREVEGRNRLEFPIGRVLFETSGWISHPRFSADGQSIAFIEHPIPHDDEGHVVVVEIGRQIGRRQPSEARIVSSRFVTLQGLAWRQGKIWFTASRKGPARSLYCVDLAATEHPMYHGLGNLRLHDSTAAGKLLISADRGSNGIYTRHANDLAERDISWHEQTCPRDISDDGRTVLIEEAGTGGRYHYCAYLRAVDGSSTRMIADGLVPLVLSPDQRRVILRMPEQLNRLAVLDLASGLRTLIECDEANPLVHTEFVSFFPDGDRIVFSATDRQGGQRIYLQALSGGKPICFAPHEHGLKMFTNRAVAPDGQRIVLMDANGRLCLYQLADSRGAPLVGLPIGFNLITWADCGEHLFVHRWDAVPARIYKYRLSDGHMDEWLALCPRHAAADVKRIPSVRMSPDGRSYIYSVKRVSSDLYVFEES